MCRGMSKKGGRGGEGWQSYAFGTTFNWRWALLANILNGPPSPSPPPPQLHTMIMIRQFSPRGFPHKLSWDNFHLRISILDSSHLNSSYPWQHPPAWDSFPHQKTWNCPQVKVDQGKLYTGELFQGKGELSCNCSYSYSDTDIRVWERWLRLKRIGSEFNY